jgi:vanillate O-demethylase monooxygenase subunit
MKARTGKADIHLDVAGEARLHEALRRCWHPVCRVDDLREKPVGATLLDEHLVVVRLGDEIACFPDLCVHRGTALSLGWVDDGSLPAPDGSGTVGEPCLVCAYHGWSYDRRGVVRRIPAVHGRSIPNRARVARYATATAVGLVWVLLEPGPGGWERPSAAYPLPQADSWWDQPGYRTIKIDTYDWACSAARRIENFVDFSHFPWVHPDVLGDRSNPVSPEHEVRDDGRTISFDVALEEPQASVKGDAAPGAKVQRDPTTYTLHLPLSVTLDQRLPPSPDRPDGNHFVLFLAVAPLTARSCRSFTWNARTYRLGAEADAELAAFQALILDQDRPVVESQRPEELPVDLSAELHIAGPDKASIAYRRRLAELAAIEG